MKRLLLILLALTGCAQQPAVDKPAAEAPTELTRIAFGSCLQQGKPQPIFSAVLDASPELFIFLGDNIYGDTEDMDVLRQKWTEFSNDPGIRRLFAQTHVLATWDDHDYGENDAGKEYPKKEQSKQIMLDVFGEPVDSARRMRPGVYDARTFGPPGRRVQVILLDTRWFRDPLSRAVDRQANRGPYVPNPDPAAALLGPAQWDWLRARLSEPAELRIIASSIQFVPEDHGWERWAAFPAERQRMLRLLSETAATGVIVITGDRHHAEISALTDGTPYPLYDITSSSLNKPGGSQRSGEPNRWRIAGDVYTRENFGLIEIDWSRQPAPGVRLSIRDVNGVAVLEQQIDLSSLRPSPPPPG